MPKKNADYEAQTIGFDFGDAGESSVSLSDLPANIVANLAVHGLSQKLGDSYAGAKTATADTEIDPNEWCKAQMESVFDQLKDGNWTVRVAGAGTVTDLARAMEIAMDGEFSLDQCVEKLSETSKEEKAELRKHPAVKKELDAIKLARQAAKAEASAAAAEDAPALSF